MELDGRELQRLKELVPYKVLSPTPDEIIKEIERLNNIIEKLEKWLNEGIKKEIHDGLTDEYLSTLDMAEYTLEKIKALKEGK